MRFVFGIIVGCLLTIGAAYVHDAAIPAASADAADPAGNGRMVNWAVVNHNLSDLDGWVRSQWAWISGRAGRAG